MRRPIGLAVPAQGGRQHQVDHQSVRDAQFNISGIANALAATPFRRLTEIRTVTL